MSKMREILISPIFDNNPIALQILGICSALAVTTLVKPAFIMALSVIFVTAFSNLAIALLRKGIPKQIRMIVQLVVIAFLVTVVEQVLKAFNYETWKQLSVFIGLIITNCIVMGRLEAFALGNPPGPAFLDGLANGLGYSVILFLIASVRELLGGGTWLNMHVMPEGYPKNGLMLIAPGAFIVLGLIIWAQRSINHKFEA